jgi:hypothetical protein
MKRYSLEFVKNGEPFELPPWTVLLHEQALNNCLKETAGKDPMVQDKEFRFYVILESLHQVDEQVTMLDIRKMHVDDMLELFDAVYSAGKRGILFHEKPPTKSKLKE